MLPKIGRLEGDVEAGLIDISPQISEATPVWPGDTAFARAVTSDLSDSDPVTINKITTTPHIGAHADAPAHTRIDGATIGAVPLTPYLGEALVVDVTGVVGAACIGPVEAATARFGGRLPQRLILRTYTKYPSEWESTFAGVAPELTHWFADRGGVLIGIDGASFDPMDSKTMDGHHAASDRNVAILEGLCLDGVEEGIYELIALPLKFRDLDASPVRAVLRTYS
ncbi:cyclase family protein [Rhodococcus globerulus]|uniref:cyclase family protein n=1 Tax=Rhodococcus globerulus TaxID=33008 RepID=UPI001C59CF6B|nr:cyclase family protein [Rhodococcus globerulus]QXW00194.1 cyclase family protein [Rhodococcus globerulus]